MGDRSLPSGRLRPQWGLDAIIEAAVTGRPSRRLQSRRDPWSRPRAAPFTGLGTAQPGGLSVVPSIYQNSGCRGAVTLRLFTNLFTQLLKAESERPQDHVRSLGQLEDPPEPVRGRRTGEPSAGETGALKEPDDPGGTGKGPGKARWGVQRPSARQVQEQAPPLGKRARASVLGPRGSWDVFQELQASDEWHVERPPSPGVQTTLHIPRGAHGSLPTRRQEQRGLWWVSDGGPPGEA